MVSRKCVLVQVPQRLIYTPVRKSSTQKSMQFMGIKSSVSEQSQLLLSPEPFDSDFFCRHGQHDLDSTAYLNAHSHSMCFVANITDLLYVLVFTWNNLIPGACFSSIQILLYSSSELVEYTFSVQYAF